MTTLRETSRRAVAAFFCEMATKLREYGVDPYQLLDGSLDPRDVDPPHPRHVPIKDRPKSKLKSTRGVRRAKAKELNL
jgi:hypothetical protein